MTSARAPAVSVFFIKAEDGIRDVAVTGVQTCALPISRQHCPGAAGRRGPSEVAPCVTGARGAPLLYHVGPSSLLVTLHASGRVGDRERGLAIRHGLAGVAGAALLPGLHL